MAVDWKRILESKRQLRRNLARRSLAEKLTLLDALRQRSLDLRAAQPVSPTSPLTPQQSTLPQEGEEPF